MDQIRYAFVALPDASYLDDMQLRLGTYFDVGVNQCGLSGQYLAELFVSSGLAGKFERCIPRYVAGMSGVDLLERALEYGGIAGEVPNEPRWPTSPDYWVGYTLPCYQVSTGCTYKRLFQVLDYDDLRGMHYRYQDRSEADFVAGVQNMMQKRAGDSRLRTVRKAAGFTQSQLATLAGVSLRSVQLYEQREKDINRAAAETVRRLACTLGCSMEDLME